ncbi:MAG: hypothetical protein F9K35_07000 [Burkholderiaceae bacterium]|nr:MAG: hypothetical protein F9K35_07000 [Burkholderiaceae bacterium]
MAMVKCKECGGQVSTKATTCPHCGAKTPKRTSLFTWIVAGAFAVVVGSCVMGFNGSEERRQKAQAAQAAIEAAKTPEQREAEAKAKAKQEADFQFSLAAAKAVRAAMKDPASFELVRADMMDSGALCMVYRGKNSFGAVTTEQAAITRKLKAGDWNKECGGKSGEDIGRLIKQAL